MCGICGILHYDKDHAVDPSIVGRMTEKLAHRGPDDDGTHCDGQAAFGFRRLSIVDLEHGHQPMSNADGTIWIVFNGEIYNHAELRTELVAKGYSYRSRCDTETIIHIYESEGIDGIKRLNGMFALAIWDKRNRLLLLARDRLGIKPLHVAITEDKLVFASEIKAIVEHPEISPRLNEQAIEEYLLFRCVAGEQTLFEGITDLLPGHILVWKDGHLSRTKFWDLPDQSETVEIVEENAIDQLDELLSESVRARLMSDVPLGTMCSGGVDSSLTTAYASNHIGERLNTFSVGFHEAEYDETVFARSVSAKYGTTHHEVVVSNIQFADALPRMIWFFDEPLNHANSIQIYFVSKLARQFVTVVLTGEGADELFAGYPRYLIVKLLSSIAWLPGILRSVGGSLLSVLPSHRLRKLGQYMPQSLEDALLFNAAFVEPEIVRNLLAAKCTDPFQYRRELVGKIAGSSDHPLDCLLRLDLKTYLVAILGRMDKMTMAASIEGRVPFLDHRLVEWAARLSTGLKLPGLQTKPTVKRLAERYLPHEVVHRKKSGFGVPIAAWLRDCKGLGRYLELFEQSGYRERSYLRTVDVCRLACEHKQGKADHSDILWQLINLELWHRIFIANETYWISDNSE